MDCIPGRKNFAHHEVFWHGTSKCFDVRPCVREVMLLDHPYKFESPSFSRIVGLRGQINMFFLYLLCTDRVINEPVMFFAF